MTDVFTPPQDRFNDARGRFWLLGESSSEAIGFVPSRQIPSNGSTKTDSFPILARELFLLLPRPVSILLRHHFVFHHTGAALSAPPLLSAIFKAGLGLVRRHLGVRA